MKITVFIYDKDNDSISTRRIEEETLYSILEEYGTNIEYVTTNALNIKIIEKVYDEFEKKVRR